MGWNWKDFHLEKNPTDLLARFPVYSYHSIDDEIVPVSHQGFITSKIPHAVVRTLSGYGPEFSRKEFVDIVHYI